MITQNALQRMIHPLYGRLIAASKGELSSPALLIITHEYVFPLQQQNLYLLLEHMLSHQPEVPLRIEGIEGPLSINNPSNVANRQQRVARALAILQQPGQLACDVLTQLYPASGRIFGVDNADLLHLQQSQYAIIKAHLGKSPVSQHKLEALFATIQQDLEDGILLEPTLRNLLALQRKWEAGETSPLEYTLQLSSYVAAEQLSLDQYPAVSALLQCNEREQLLDQAAIDERASELHITLQHYARISLPKKLAIEIEQWVEKVRTDALTFNLPSREYLDLIAGELPSSYSQIKASTQPWRYLRADLLPTWFKGYTIMKAGVENQKYPVHFYLTRLTELLDMLDIQLDPSDPLQAYREYVSLTGTIMHFDLTVELPALVESLINHYAVTATERRIVKLNRQLYDVKHLLRLTLPAARISAALRDDQSIIQRNVSSSVRQLGSEFKDDRLARIGRA